MKNILISITSVILLAYAVGACKLFKGTGVPEAKINFIIGDVLLNGTKVSEPGKTVSYNDSIETGDNGLCRILIGDKTLLQINSGSKLVYKISKDDNTLELGSGELAGITRKIFTEKGVYNIKTPTLSAAVRGTSYFVKIENPGSSYFCVCNGTINLAGEDNSSTEKVSASHHMGRRYKKGDDGTITAEEAGMLYHDDNIINDLARNISEKVDWTKPDKQ